jgi:hypothetical protein
VGSLNDIICIDINKHRMIIYKNIGRDNIRKKRKLNSDKIWKLWKKNKLNSEKIRKMWKKSKLKSEKIG